MKIQYERNNLHGKTLRLLEQANAIIDEYQTKGFSLTLRQLYYQFVARGLLANKQANYKMLGEVLSSGRRNGLVDWDAIVDRTRFLRRPPSWTSPQDILSSCANQYKADLWANQPNYVEVWFEKDALLGVFERACEDFRLPMFSCRGYVSDSECWAAAQRFEAAERDGKECVLLHFGDHDPSGLDMTRDIGDRLFLFGASHVNVRRLALNMDQVEEYNPPPNPAKETDSRFADYLDKYGDESWELDALSPEVLAALVAKEVESLVVAKRWKAGLKQETIDRTTLASISNNYGEVKTFLANL